MEIVADSTPTVAAQQVDAVVAAALSYDKEHGVTTQMEELELGCAASAVEHAVDLCTAGPLRVEMLQQLEARLQMAADDPASLPIIARLALLELFDGLCQSARIAGDADFLDAAQKRLYMLIIQALPKQLDGRRCVQLSREMVSRWEAEEVFAKHHLMNAYRYMDGYKPDLEALQQSAAVAALARQSKVVSESKNKADDASNDDMSQSDSEPFSQSASSPYPDDSQTGTGMTSSAQAAESDALTTQNFRGQAQQAERYMERQRSVQKKRRLQQALRPPNEKPSAELEEMWSQLLHDVGQWKHKARMQAGVDADVQESEPSGEQVAEVARSEFEREWKITHSWKPSWSQPRPDTSPAALASALPSALLDPGIKAGSSTAPRADAKSSGVTVLLWDLDETLIIYQSLIAPKESNKYAWSADANATALGEAMEKLLFRVQDDYLLFKDLEAFERERVSFGEVQSKGLAVAQGRVFGPPTLLEANRYPVIHNKKPDMFAVAQRYAYINAVYEATRTESAGSLWQQMPRDLVQQMSEASSRISKACGNWTQLAKFALKKTSQQNCVHVLISNSELLSMVVKLIAFGLAEFFPAENLYSSVHMGKSRAFEQAYNDFSARYPGAVFRAVGDGDEEERVAARMFPRVASFHRIGKAADLVTAMEQITGPPAGAPSTPASSIQPETKTNDERSRPMGAFGGTDAAEGRGRAFGQGIVRRQQQPSASRSEPPMERAAHVPSDSRFESQAAFPPHLGSLHPHQRGAPLMGPQHATGRMAPRLDDGHGGHDGRGMSLQQQQLYPPLQHPPPQFLPPFQHAQRFPPPPQHPQQPNPGYGAPPWQQQHFIQRQPPYAPPFPPMRPGRG